MHTYILNIHSCFVHVCIRMHAGTALYTCDVHSLSSFRIVTLSFPFSPMENREGPFDGTTMESERISSYSTAESLMIRRGRHTLVAEGGKVKEMLDEVRSVVAAK